MIKLLDYGIFSFSMSDDCQTVTVESLPMRGEYQRLDITLNEQEEFRTGLRLAFARAAREQERINHARLPRSPH